MWQFYIIEFLKILSICFCFLLSIIFQRSLKFKGYSYSLVVVGCFIMAISFPIYFTSWGGFELSKLITPSIQIIMFGMGTTMGFRDFIRVAKNPKGVFIGVSCQYLIMSLIGFSLASLSGLPPEIAAGIILVGCSPGGMASNVIVFLAKANVPLSITITAFSTMLSPFIMPFLMKIFAGAFIEVDVLFMMWNITKMIIFPVVVGLIFNHFFNNKFQWLNKTMVYLSMFGIAFSIVIIAAAGYEYLISIGWLLLILVVIHNLTGYFLGYHLSRFLKMDEKDCRTIAIEVGMQNAGLASGIATEIGKLATMGLAPAIFGPLMNVTGSILASRWHQINPVDNG